MRRWFVLIDATDGTYAVHAETWWPVLDGTSLWVEQAEYWNEENWVAPSIESLDRMHVAGVT